MRRRRSRGPMLMRQTSGGASSAVVESCTASTARSIQCGASAVSHDPYASLRFPEYRAYLGAMASASIGTQAQTAVLGWQVYQLTGDPLSLGLIGLAEAVPFLALTLVGGWVADRMDRRTLSLAGLAAIGASGMCLLLLSLGEAGSALPFYGAQALAGLGRAFFRPAYAALGTELVPREHYQNAATWRSSV